MSWGTLGSDGRLKDRTGIAPQGVVFAAGRAVTQSAATTDVIKYDSELIDPFGWYDTGTWRFTPKLAGYYELRAVIATSVAMTADRYGYIQMRKNGAGALTGTLGYDRGSGIQVTVSGVLYLNGSTDYVDVIFVHNNGGTVTLSNNTLLQFSGHLVGVSTGVIPEPWHVVGATGEPAFSSGWSVSSATGVGPRFMKDPHGFVHLQGHASVTGSQGSGAGFTLPAGYRPGYIQYLTGRYYTTSWLLADVVISTNGAVQFLSTTDAAIAASNYVSFDGITFRAEL